MLGLLPSILALFWLGIEGIILTIIGDQNDYVCLSGYTLLPTATFHRVADGLLVSAKRVAKRDHWEACYFASLFSHFRDFRCEQIVLDTAKDALSEEPRDKRSRSRLKRFARAAAGSASLQAG